MVFLLTQPEPGKLTSKQLLKNRFCYYKPKPFVPTATLYGTHTQAELAQQWLGRRLLARRAGTPHAHARSRKGGAPGGGAGLGGAGRRDSRAEREAAARIPELRRRWGAVRLLPRSRARGRDELGLVALAPGAVRAARAGGAAGALPAGRWRPDPAVGRVAGPTSR